MNDTTKRIMDLADTYRAQPYPFHAEARQALQNELERLFTPLDIQPPNDAGETMCLVRWMAETPRGWVGAHYFDALNQLSIKG